MTDVDLPPLPSERFELIPTAADVVAERPWLDEGRKAWEARTTTR